MRTKKILLILIVLFIFGYTGSWWGGSWYLDSGNHYFHIVGGFFIALLTTSYYASEFGKLTQPFRFFALLGIVMAVGVFWEFHEFALDHLLHLPHFQFQGDLVDTMQDLLFDTIGGIAAALYTARRWNS